MAVGHPLKEKGYLPAMVSLSPLPPALSQSADNAIQPTHVLRDKAAEALLETGWTLLYSGVTPRRTSVTLLDPSQRLQITLQIPLTEDDQDWDLWLEGCADRSSEPLQAMLQAEAVMPTTHSRLPAKASLVEKGIGVSDMIQVARWLEDPIEQIERLAEHGGGQLVVHLAGLGPNS